MNKELKEWKLYAHINKTNHKTYIGITHQKPECRWRSNGKGYKRCTAFWRAIQKYGWDGFYHIILIDNLNKEEAEKYEKLFICALNTTNYHYGYNISKGEEVANYHDYNRSSLSKKVYQYDLSGNFIREWDSTMEIQRQLKFYNTNISKCCTNKLKQYKGYQWKYYYADKIDSLKSGRERTMAASMKKIYQYDKNDVLVKTWSSATEAANNLGIDIRNISACCHNKRNFAGGFKWSYVDF